MFQELWPLLQRRESLVIHVLQNADQVRIIVMPSEGNIIENPSEAELAALRQSIVIDGTPEALDNGLASELLNKGVEAHRTLEEQAITIHDSTAAAVAAMEEERKAKLKSKSPSTTSAKKSITKKPEPPPEPPKKPLPPGLFDAPSESPAETEPAPASQTDAGSTPASTPAQEPAPAPAEPRQAANTTVDPDEEEEAELLRTPIDDNLLAAA